MVRTSILAGVVAMSASASAFLAPIPGHSLARSARSASVQMVTSPGVSPPSVSSTMASSEAVYTDALKKMEADCLADLEKAFDETAKTAKAESEKIWGELNAEFAEDDA